MGGYPRARPLDGRPAARHAAGPAIATELTNADPAEPTASRNQKPLFLRLVDASRITPNVVTLIGFLGLCGAAALVLDRRWILAAAVFVVFGLVDSLDGALARYQGTESEFGAFLDSILDRLVEGVILGAIGVVMAQDGREWIVAACFGALTGSFLVSYARARAEGLGVKGTSGGLMGRPERLVLLGAGLFLGSVGEVLPAIIVLLAVLSLMTAGQRLWTVWEATR